MRNMWHLVVNADDQILAMCGSALPEWAEHQYDTLTERYPGVALKRVVVITEEKPHTGMYLKEFKELRIVKGKDGT